MKPDAPARIPVPLPQRWHEARIRVLPVLVFAGVLAAAAMLWKNHIAAPGMVGQAEPVLANVSCYKPGVLSELSVNRFQRVKLGDPIGRVMITDPKILLASLAVFQSEIAMLQATMSPIADRQRVAMNYDQLRLNWLRQRAQLAAARAGLQYADSEYRRMETLFKDKIVAERSYEQARAARDKLQDEVNELTKLVAECETHFQELQVTNAAELSKVSTDPLVAAIAVQESKLRQTEAELSPILVKAPMDGIVTAIFHRAGEAVTPGQPIVAIATLDPVRIVGYLRPPISHEPKVGMKVCVRTRGLRPETGSATIMEVGTQFEPVPPALLGPVNFANIVQGLPIDISLPSNLKIRAGELVDITLLTKQQ